MQSDFIVLNNNVQSMNIILAIMHGLYICYAFLIARFCFFASSYGGPGGRVHKQCYGGPVGCHLRASNF